MTDIAELVQRVRKLSGERYPVYIYDETLLGELADALETQARRIAELERGVLDVQVAMYERWQIAKPPND